MSFLLGPRDIVDDQRAEHSSCDACGQSVRVRAMRDLLTIPLRTAPGNTGRTSIAIVIRTPVSSYSSTYYVYGALGRLNGELLHGISRGLPTGGSSAARLVRVGQQDDVVEAAAHPGYALLAEPTQSPSNPTRRAARERTPVVQGAHAVPNKARGRRAHLERKKKELFRIRAQRCF